jgi:hypothetical protein
MRRVRRIVAVFYSRNAAGSPMATSLEEKISSAESTQSSGPTLRDTDQRFSGVVSATTATSLAAYAAASSSEAAQIENMRRTQRPVAPEASNVSDAGGDLVRVERRSSPFVLFARLATAQLGTLRFRKMERAEFISRLPQEMVAARRSVPALLAADRGQQCTALAFVQIRGACCERPPRRVPPSEGRR